MGHIEILPGHNARIVNLGYPASIITDIHSPDKCAGKPCTIHNPTNHKMKEWVLVFRDDIGIFERLCSHGVGHPDPDSLEYYISIGIPEMESHGCDGCCKNILSS